MKPATLRRISGPDTEPVTLAEAKAQLHILSDQTVEDSYITALITAARQWCEEWTKRSFIEQVWEAQYECWPCNGTFLLARPNIISVDQVEYVDYAGDEQVVDDSEYFTAINAFPGEVKFPLATGPLLATLQQDNPYPIKITFTAGFGDASGDVPQIIKQAILMMVHHFYVQRTPASVVPLSKVPMSVESLLQSFRAYNT